MKPNKDVESHPQFVLLAKRENDLRYVLLTYGKQLGPALKHVRKEFKKACKDCDILLKTLEKQGYKMYLSSSPKLN